MSKRKPYNRHDKEFKREAIRLIKTSDKPVAQIGREIGVHSSTLYDWLQREEKINAPEEVVASNLNEKEEIRRLQKEL